MKFVTRYIGDTVSFIVWSLIDFIVNGFPDPRDTPRKAKR